MREHMARFAAAFGVTGMRQPDRTPNTRAALALAEWARERGKLTPFREAVMAAHWREGKDIEDPAVLAECARAAGLDAAEARAALDDPTFTERVDRMAVEAARAGVTGIPTFIVGKGAVVGCQPYEELEGLMQAAGVPRTKGTP
jgi:predicted DsbA family dithiol-disulfide isomerase